MRIKRMQASMEFLLFYMKKGEHHFKVTKGALPSDARLIGIQPDSLFEKGVYWLLIESDEFENLPEASVIPIIPGPTFEETGFQNSLKGRDLK